MTVQHADPVAARIDALMIRDRNALRGLRRAIERREAAGKPASVLRGRLDTRLERAERRLAERCERRPAPSYPDALPITAARERIVDALHASQVLVVCGDTGSGKTTQLPKLCVEAGRGIRGSIGHTQPRRIAAQAVARRLAEELGVELGREVGCKTRFNDMSRPSSLIKVMTDGVLLNEIRADPDLAAYDTLIIDEAHERSLNIDFLLGYLRPLLRRRPDLKLIVTSATIDPARFAGHFGGAPVIEVEGRSFAVEIRYRPPERGQDLADAIVAAVHELDAAEPGTPGGGAYEDILVFLPGERWIRDAENALKRNGPSHFDVLPLYARLSASRQQAVFEPGAAPRIVLATNVAETSLTVPRIGYVIDSGLARVSRYAARHRVQRLGVEPIARANADQRAGRCGRLAPGVCVRLFSRQDYEARPRFEEPEIVRTDLAGVILRLEAMGLGRIDAFPFLDEPPTKSVNDAHRLLHVLGALDGDGALTADGAVMGRLPLDPRLARLLIAARDNECLRDALVLAAGLSIVDPRESAAAADEQGELVDPRSDFASLLKLWRASRAARRGGRKALRAWCERRGVSLARLNEWHDVHGQLFELVRELGWRADRGGDYKRIHQAVLTAFIDFIAERADRTHYRGMHDAKARLFPSSPLAKRKPRWVVAAEHIATEHAYLRTIAQINPRWALDAAPHLLKRDYRQPQWHRGSGRVLAREVVGLFGLTLCASRRVDYSRVDAAAARRIFIEEALVGDELGAPCTVLDHNRRLREELLEAEARIRSRDLFAGGRAMTAFYTARLPESICDRGAFLAWCRDESLAAALRMTRDDLATREPPGPEDERYPATLDVAGQALGLHYRFEPAAQADGITVTIPRVLLPAVRPEHVEWLVPGWLEEKIVALLRTLPKEQRRPLVPLPDTARRLLAQLGARRRRQPLVPALAEIVSARCGVAVDAADFEPARLPEHLSMRIELVDASGAVVAAGRDLGSLRRRHAEAVAKDAATHGAGTRWAAQGLVRWSIPDLPDAVDVDGEGPGLTLYPALTDAAGRVDLRLLPPGPAAAAQHRLGVRRLLLRCMPAQTALIRESVLDDHALLLAFHGIGDTDALCDDLMLAGVDECFDLTTPVRDKARFEACLAAGRGELSAAVAKLKALLAELLPVYRRARTALDDDRLRADARTDIARQLEALIHPRLLSSTPVPWRRRLPRYVRAVEVRLDKLRRRHPKDADHQARIERAEQRFVQWRATLPAEWPLPAAMVRYRWMVEEYRVSLFAQALGTALPVSDRRLDDAWQAALEEASAT